MPGLVKPKHQHKIRKFKSLQEPRVDLSLSFINDLKANKYQLDQGQGLPSLVESLLGNP